MKDNPERMAWVILLLSFFSCVGLAVAVPLGTRWYVLNARVGQSVALEVQPGPLSVTRGGRGKPEYIVEDLDDVQEGTIIVTEATAGRLVMHTVQSDESVAATVQLYDNTRLVLSSARSPRFSASDLNHEVALELRAGRVRVGVPVDGERSTVVHVRTPHGVATLLEGSHEVKVNGRTTEVIVRDGEAELGAEGRDVVALRAAERATSDGIRVLGPLSAERNVLVNGDFRESLESGWQPYTKDVQQEPPGTVEVITSTDRLVAWFHREGIGHAEVGIRQDINYDVRDFTSLLLYVNVQVRGQSLPGCGSLGSECPIIVRIDYEDIHGVDREWYHGFYAAAAASNDLLHPWDEQIPLQTWYGFDSGNLIEAFEAPPAYVRELHVYASGHSFDALVTEVELLVKE